MGTLYPMALNPQAVGLGCAKGWSPAALRPLLNPTNSVCQLVPSNVWAY